MLGLADKSKIISLFKELLSGNEKVALIELKNLIKEANIPCPENSITAIIKIININFLFFSINSFIYCLSIFYLYKYNNYKYLTYFGQFPHPKLV